MPRKSVAGPPEDIHQEREVLFDPPSETGISLAQQRNRENLYREVRKKSDSGEITKEDVRNAI